MANNQVSVEITLEEKAALKALTQLTKEVQKTEDSFTKMGKEGDESLGKVNQATQGIGGSFKSLVGGVTIANLASNAILDVANGLKNFALDSINAAVEQEQATTKLAQSLRAAGDFSADALDDLSAYANTLSLITKFSDDAIISQLAVAKSFGATNNEAKELVQAAANLAATFGGSLDSNVEKLGKTFSGSAGRLAQFIPELKNLTKEQLVAGDAIDIINSKFAGAASSELETYAGRIGQLTKAFGEFQEAIGTLAINSGITDYFQTYGQVLQDINQYMSDSQIESARQREGFVETSASIEQLTRKMNELKVEAIDAEQIVNNPSFFDKLLARPQAAAENIKRLNQEIASIQETINKANASRAPQAEEPEEKKRGGGISEADQKLIDSRRAMQTEIALINEQSRIAEDEQTALVNEQLLGSRELEVQQVYEFEARKLEAQFAAEEEKAMLIKNSTDRNLKLQEIGAKRELEFTKMGNAQIKAENQRKIKDQEAINAHLLATASNFLAAGQLLARDGSNVQKALQITQATISTYTAANNALAQPVPYPVAVAMASSAVALGLANVAKIAGAKFEYGGIVKGNSMTGDSVPVRVNSGEMILNRQQQTSLFNMANEGVGGSDLIDEIRALRRDLASQPIVLSVDGRALANVIRGEVRSGFKLS